MSDPASPRPVPSAAAQKAAERHRTRVNLIAAAAVLALIGLTVWTLGVIDDNRRLDRCFSTGRRDCAPVAAPPREGVFQPAR